MGEIERRRRRLRPPSAAPAPVPGPPPGGPPAVPPADDVLTSAIEDPVAPAAGGSAVPGEEAPRPARPTGPTRQPRARPASGAGPPGDDSERGLRGLVGSGSSQVSVGAALRARDAARPTDEHIAEAEAHLPIVRRNWTPREDLPHTR